jgi:DNA polymerase II small subunit
LVSKVLARGYQIEPDAFSFLSEISVDVNLESFLGTVIESKSSQLDRTIRRSDLEGALPREPDEPSTTEGVAPLEEVLVIEDPTKEIAPLEAEEGFKKLFQDRYSRLLTVVRRRPDSKNIVPIELVKQSKEKNRRVAGLLSSRNSRKAGADIVLDDPTGTLRVNCGEEIATVAMSVPLDSMVVVEVSNGKGGQLYATNLVVPDIPNRKPVGSPHRSYAVLLSDLHIGSKMFIEEDFRRFLSWLKGELGDADIVKRIKYVVVAGDIVDGIGVYPGQEDQLVERNLRRQYALAGGLLREIPKSMKVLLSPGNHDAVRQALPQPVIPIEIARPLYEIENVVNIGDPAYVKLGGVTFLVYHGRSLDDVIATVPELTYDRPVDAMRVLLKSRHLAPIYGKRTQLSPEAKDMLVVDSVPDVFHAGHVHTVDVGEYRGTIMVNSGTFQARTPFQANVGIDPIPSIVPIVNLSTLVVEKRSFGRQSFVSEKA